MFYVILNQMLIEKLKAKTLHLIIFRFLHFEISLFPNKPSFEYEKIKTYLQMLKFVELDY